MSTIAYRDGILAVDGRLSAGNSIFSDSALKMLVAPSCCFAVSGGFARGLALIRHLAETPNDPDRWDLPSDGDAVLQLLPDGVLRVIENGAWFTTSDAYAEGSGGSSARSAMLMGASAVEAVAVASRVDVWTGGVIRAASWQSGRLSAWRIPNEQRCRV